MCTIHCRFFVLNAKNRTKKERKYRDALTFYRRKEELASPKKNVVVLENIDDKSENEENRIKDEDRIKDGNHVSQDIEVVNIFERDRKTQVYFQQ